MIRRIGLMSFPFVAAAVMAMTLIASAGCSQQEMSPALLAGEPSPEDPKITALRESGKSFREIYEVRHPRPEPKGTKKRSR